LLYEGKRVDVTIKNKGSSLAQSGKRFFGLLKCSSHYGITVTIHFLEPLF